MKKALIVLLILAVAGGLFAQTTLSFSASVQTGLAIGMDDRDGDDGNPKIDFVNNRGENGMRGNVVANVRSGDDAPYGAWGGQVYLRVRQNNLLDLGDEATRSLNYRPVDYYVFWQPNSFLYLQIGTDGGNPYETMGAINRSQGVFDANGLKVRLTPIDGLVLAGQAFYGAAGATIKFLDKTDLAFAAQYTATGLFKTNANIRYYADRGDDKVDFGVGFNFLGLGGVGFSKLAADIATYNFGGKDAYMGFGPSVEFKALDNNLTLGAKAGFYMYTGDDSAADGLPMYIHGNLSYKIDRITPAIEARYVTGKAPSFNYRDAGEIGAPDLNSFFNKAGRTTGTKDSVAFGISPSISFSVGPTVILGYNLQMDLSDGAAATATAKTLQHLIYAGVNISF